MMYHLYGYLHLWSKYFYFFKCIIFNKFYSCGTMIYKVLNKYKNTVQLI